MTDLTKTHHNPLFLSPQDVAEIISREGMVKTLQGMAQSIREDFLRWESFDKSARLASHSRDGVIELMPISDADTYTFKYVNGHPKNTALGLSTVMAFGV
ncbi:MAG: ornithine cyclodeaminase, partial [Polaromonas sp.]